MLKSNRLLQKFSQLDQNCSIGQGIDMDSIDGTKMMNHSDDGHLISPAECEAQEKAKKDSSFLEATSELET